MEDSRKGKGDGEKELSTPNPHVDGGKSKRAIVYNTKEGKKEREGEKRRYERKKEKTRRIVYSQVITLNHIRGGLLCLYKRIILSF